MNNQPTLAQWRFLHPRYWGIWLGYWLMVFITALPHRAQIRFGALLGWIAWHFARSRKHIVGVNLQLCFPELSDEARKAMARQNFRHTGISLVETARSWLRDPNSARDRVTLHGLDTLLAAKAEGKGVILLGMHLSTLDYAGAVLSTHCGF
ncbi:MAG: lauroyl acyltransferase, partial [Pseudomonadales bacterium]|nr:lauroyl acyltransferase [Pseudomonadales bacterium]